MIPKIAITTTSFAKFDNQPLQLLKDSEFDVVLNPYGRKLSGEEVVKHAADESDLKASSETGIYFIVRIVPGNDNLLDCPLKVEYLYGLEEVIGKLTN